MLKFRYMTLLVLMTMQIGAVTFAQPVALHTWVSGNGDDNNNSSCYQTAPCRSLEHAISQTYAGGEVVILDAGYFPSPTTSSITIAKSITIRSDQAASSVPGYERYAITIFAGPSDKVTLDGLDINGFGPLGRPTGAVETGLAGVSVVQAGDLIIRNCRIHGFTASAGGEGAAILVNSSKTRVTIENSFLTENLYGVLISAPKGQAHVKMFNTSVVSNSVAGVKVTAGNDVLLSGNRIIASPKSLDLSGGGIATS